MNVAIRNNGWVNGKLASVRWIEMGPDKIALAVGAMVTHIPMRLTGGVEVSVEAPNGFILRTDDIELRIEANLVLKLASDGRITVNAPGKDRTFSITARHVDVEEPEPEVEYQ